jgi:hypothetical protein
MTTRNGIDPTLVEGLASNSAVAKVFTGIRTRRAAPQLATNAAVANVFTEDVIAVAHAGQRASHTTPGR